MYKASTLIIAPHGDDEILGCGGYLSQTSDAVNVVVVADRSYPPDQSQRINQTINALKVLRSPSVTFLNFEDEKLYFHMTDIAKRIEEIINQHRPSTVMIPFCGDNNQDHKTVYDSCSIALRRFAVPFVKKILCYEVPSSTEQTLPASRYAFTPNYFIPLTLQNFNSKIEAFNCYQTECRSGTHPRSVTSIESLSRWRGSMCNSEFAESYMLQYYVEC